MAETSASGYFPPVEESAIPFPQEGKSSSTGLRYGKAIADQDIVVHTLCLGLGADTDLLEAIAKLTGGYDIVVPGGTASLTKMSSVHCPE